MEYINKIELQGVIGSTAVSAYNKKRVVNFTLCTEYASRAADGSAVVECTWHNCTAFENKDIPAEVINALDKGVFAHVEGRLRCKMYTTADGETKRYIDIFINKLEIVQP